MHKCFAYNCEKVGNNCEQDTTLDKIGRAIGWAARTTGKYLSVAVDATAQVLKGAAKVASVTGKMLWHALENTAKGTIYVGGKMIDGFEWALKKWDKKS